ncbi:copper homeostasis CutC domain-containing protein [Camillea tinctor]|nr:copper homeostasis CutC domain-containing protein [Camillea tinctor]
MPGITGKVCLEMPIFGTSAAEQAVRWGALRFEVNAPGSYSAGGLTPSLADLRIVTELGVPLRVMIRPRGPPSEGRDFIYSEEEFSQMERDILQFRKSGLLEKERGDGFVFGILEENTDTQETGATTQRCWVDVQRCARLVKAARPFTSVFHRAFDEIVSSSGGCEDEDPGSWNKALKDVTSCGFSAILTSGGLGKAIQNVETLQNICREADPLCMEIIVGGGVRKINVSELVEKLNLGTEPWDVFVHSACLSGQPSEEVDQDEVQGIVSQLQQPDRYSLSSGR